MRRSKRAHWVLLGKQGEHTEALAVCSMGGSVLRSIESVPVDGLEADRVARRLSRRRPLGVIVAIPVDHAGRENLAAGDAAILGRLVQRSPALPVVAMVCDPALPASMTVLGGPCVSGVDGALDRILQETAEAAVSGLRDDAVPLDPDALLLPALVRDRSEAWRAAVQALEHAAPDVAVSELYVAARPDDLAALQTIMRDGAIGVGGAPARGIWRRFAVAGAVVGGCGIAAAIGLQWSVEAATRDVVRHAVELQQAALSPAEGFSHSGLSAVHDVVSLMDDDETRLPFVPSSWSGDVSALLQDQIVAALPTVLLDPARRHLEREHAAIVAMIDAGRPLSPSEARDLLQRLTALRDRINAFHLAASGPAARQWSTLAAAFGPGGTNLPLDWLDTEDGAAAMATALARYAWTPPSLAPLAERVLTQAERAFTKADAARRDARAIGDRLHGALTVLSATDDRGEQSMAAAVQEVLGALKALRSLAATRADHLAERRAEIDALSAMRGPTVAAGLLSPARWDNAVARLNQAWTDERAALLATRVDGLGAVFDPADSGRLLKVAPDLEAATTAMEMLMAAGVEGDASRDIPPLGPLSMAEGPPSAEGLKRAADRLGAFRAWQDSHAAALPEALQRPVLRFAVVHVALNAAVDVASAYAQGDGGAYDDAVVRDLRDVVRALGALAPSVSHDIAWLIGVRAFRGLEAVNADFEQHNIFNLRPVVARWSGQGPVLKGAEWRRAGQRRAHLSEGWLRLTAAVGRAAPLLEVLQVPGVADALDSPRLIDKWRGLQWSVSAGERALEVFTTFVETSVAEFDRAACGRPIRLPPEAAVGAGLRAEAARLAQQLETRCAEMLRAPLPGRKPSTPIATPYRLVPW